MKNTRKKILLIPSAIVLPIDMQIHFGALPTCLYPLGECTMLERIYNEYKDIVDQMYVITREKSILVKNYVHWKNLNINLIEIAETKDLGDTIKNGLQQIDYDSETDLYINFADTLVESENLASLKDSAFIKYEKVSKQWTFYKENNGLITDMIDKTEDADDTWSDSEYPFFIGGFVLSDPVLFYQNLIKSKDTKNKRMDCFYDALQTYSRSHPMNFIEPQKWYDVGHYNDYLKAKEGVASRSFNSIEIDGDRGILRKTSENKEKFIGEIQWYLKIPGKLQYMIPRIYSYSLDWNNPYVEMEYYGYITLHEIYIHGNYSLMRWQEIFDKIHLMMNDMQQFQQQDSKDNMIGAMKNIYLDKTVKRLNQMRDNPAFQSFFDQKIQINEHEYRSINDYLAILPQLIDQLLLQDFTGAFSIIHGDLCFANILQEENYHFIRMIDPRGKFGNYDIYGDPRYELAKLFHSVEGKYDYIIEDMFEVSVDHNAITYHVPDHTLPLVTLAQNVFGDKFANYSEIRLIEATLFLSMIPLHSDKLNRQYAMLATGIQLLNQVIEENLDE